MKLSILRHAALALGTTSFFLPAAAEEEAGKHSPYVIGPVIRDPAKRQIVIPVHFYWRKGDKNTNQATDLSIEFQGKTYEVHSSDTFITGSHTGTRSVVFEFIIRDWIPNIQERDQVLPELEKATELKIHFEGKADGVTQKTGGTFPVTDLSEESPENALNAPAPAPKGKERR